VEKNNHSGKLGRARVLLCLSRALSDRIPASLWECTWVRWGRWPATSRGRWQPARERNLLPTFSRSLEQSLSRALALANQQHHEYVALEHLLLALVDDQDAAAVMRACNVDIDKLRCNLVTYLESELEDLVTDGSEDSRPTAGFQGLIQRAVTHVQSSGRVEVTGANVLVAIFAERESHATFLLQEQEMTRDDAVNYIDHGIRRKARLGGE
jgi:ATP-dependent Clp protease ATP-binding subunit ClpA